MTYPPTYSFEQPAAKPPSRSNGPLIAIVIALAILLVGGAGVVGVLLLRDDDNGDNLGAGNTTPTAEAPATESPKQDGDGDARKVVYEVSGDGPVSIVYLKEDGRSLAPAQDAELPWRLELTMDENAVAVTVTAIRRGGGNGTINCRITVDGDEVAKRSATGTFATASCNKLLL